MGSVSIPQALLMARRHVEAGQLPAAESALREILLVEPGSAEALHLLGVVAYLVGQLPVAFQLIEQALAVGPNVAAFRVSLGLVLHAQRRFSEALAEYHCALQIDPRMVGAWNNVGNTLRELGQTSEAANAYGQALALQPLDLNARGNLGVVLRELGQPGAALAEFQVVAAARPGSASAQYDLGTALGDLGRHAEAAEAFHAALTLQPDYPQAHSCLGDALRQSGDYPGAAAAYRRAIALHPGLPAPRNNLGLALQALGETSAALEAFRAALQCDPCSVPALNNAGNVLRNLGEYEQAVAAYSEAIRLDPTRAESRLNLGISLQEMGRLDESLALLREAVRIRPDYVDAWTSLANALAESHDLDAAIAAHQRAAALSPDSSDVQSNLAQALKAAGLLDAALCANRRAVELDPHNPGKHSNLAYTLLFHPGTEPAAIDSENARWNQSHGEPWRSGWRAHSNERDPERTLRVGYVSADFRDHVIGRNVLPLIENHDRRQCTVVCYSGVLRPDEVTERFKSKAAHWVQTVGLGDAALAERIRADRIDILVDLTLHLARNRLPVFARRPAPVQVSFAGYPGGTGLTAIDYRINDRFLESEQDDPSVFLIQSFWCYEALADPIAVNELPAIENGFVTFWCLNNFCKVNVEVLSLWARVLHQVEHSQIALLAPEGRHRKTATDFLASRGIEAERVEFFTPRPRAQYLSLFHQLDVSLDTFPYAGHTTSLDSLWMGVPVVSLAGRTPVSRAGVSQLTNLGMLEGIAGSEDAFVRQASALARDWSGLSVTRSALRKRMLESPLMDARVFTLNIESAFRKMWQRYCVALHP